MDHRTIVSFFTCQLVWVNRYFLSAMWESGLERQKPEDQDGAEQAQDKARDDGHRHHLDATSCLNLAVNERRCFAIEHLR